MQALTLRILGIARVVTLKGSNKKRINFNLSEIPVNKKGAAGVICVKLTAGNTVVEAEVKRTRCKIKDRKTRRKFNIRIVIVRTN